MASILFKQGGYLGPGDSLSLENPALPIKTRPPDPMAQLKENLGHPIRQEPCFDEVLTECKENIDYVGDEDSNDQ